MCEAQQKGLFHETNAKIIGFNSTGTPFYYLVLHRQGLTFGMRIPDSSHGFGWDISLTTSDK